jgi:predicted nucleic acid-binding Zn ribbon protein
MDRQPLNRCVHIGEILSHLLRQHGRDSGKELTRIQELWDDTVGAGIACNARPVAYKKKLLYVSSDNSIWIQHLQFLKKDIIAGINHALGGEWVTDIKFRIGRMP